MSTVNIGDEPTGPNAPQDTGGDGDGRPEHIPEKFWDADKGEVKLEDLAKSYAELEAKFSQINQQEDQEGSQGDQEGQQGDQEGDQGVSDILSKSGLDSSKYSQELQESGQLSDASYAELEQAGFPRAMVDQYIAGSQAMQQGGEQEFAQADVNDLMDLVGGTEQFGAMQQWAAQSLSEEEVNWYNEKVASGNKMEAAAAISYVQNRYVQAEGNEGSMVTGRNNAGQNNSGYESWDQVRQAMRDPRYATDPAFRMEVERRLANSPNLSRQ